MRIVVALGGNVLWRRADAAARSLAKIARNNELIVTHGSGPLAFQAAAYGPAEPFPMDVLNARSAGMIGYQLQQALGNLLPDRDVVSVLTEVVIGDDGESDVSPADPAGRAEPREIVQIEAIKRLAATGFVVICAGGGGIPSRIDCRTGNRVGADVLIDTDLTAGLLAMEARAEVLMFLSDVDAAYADWGGDRARPIRSATVDDLAAIHFAEGTMGPKIRAACRFVELTGRHAVIGALDSARDMLDGQAGSRIIPAVDEHETIGPFGARQMALRRA